MHYQKKVKGVGAYVTFNEKQEKIYFLLFALAYIVMPVYFITQWVDFAHIYMPVWVRWAGAGVTGLGLWLFGWTHQELGIYWTAVLALSEKHKLITEGPYQVIRHPMYTSFYLIGFGFLLLSANWLVGLVYLGTLTLMYAARVGAEEKMMTNRFGNEYRQYMEKTRRLLPRIMR